MRTIQFEKSFASSDKAQFWSEKNIDIKPQNIGKKSNKKYWFKCQVCNHDFDASPGNISQGKWCPYCSQRKRCDEESCDHCFNNSFASSDKAQFWSEKNGKIKPRDVAKSSNKPYIFKCGDCHHEFKKALNAITSGGWCPYCCIPHQKRCDAESCDNCLNNSFASSDKAQFWSEKNGKIKPRDVAKSCSDEYWFKCGDCNHEFEMSTNNISGGQWCPYCCIPQRKRCDTESCVHCFNNSFASSDKAQFWSEKNGEVKPRDVAKSCSDEYWFKCGDCHHEFKKGLNTVTGGGWCPYCCFPHQKRCVEESCVHCFNNSFASSDKAQFWSEKNGEVKPRDVAKWCNKSYIFKCGDCGKNFKSNLNDISRGQWCPNCKNKTESKILAYLLSIFSATIFQYKTEWCKNKKTKRFLPFDFCIEVLKIVIELDGAQHFTQVMNWQDSYKTRKIDIFKMKCAIENGYRVIRLSQEDVWKTDNLWLDTHLKPLLNSDATFDVAFISSKDVYTDHIQDIENTPIIVFH